MLVGGPQRGVWNLRSRQVLTEVSTLAEFSSLSFGQRGRAPQLEESPETPPSSRAEGAALPRQGAWVQSLVRELDPTCHTYRAGLHISAS